VSRRASILAICAVIAACSPAAEGPPRRPPSEVLGFEQVPLSQAGPLADEAVAEDPLGPELAGERALQRSLPMVRGGLWDTLRTTRVAVGERSQLFTATHSAAVRALAGRPVTLRGYMLPLEAADRTSHFLISPYTPVCFFHPPAEPNEVVEVRLSRPIAAGYHLVEVRGVLRLSNDGEKGLFFVLEDGRGRVLERVT